MPLFLGPNGPVGDFAREIECLEALARDLKILSRLGRPPSHVLDHAPILDGFTVSSREALCLKGTVTGHPKMLSGPIVTSPLQVLAPKGGWCRTQTRFYRLGARSVAAPSTTDPRSRR